MKPIHAGNEFEKLNEIFQTISPFAYAFNSDVDSLLGDDCAIIDGAGQNIDLFASDLMAEDIHFSRLYYTPAEIGYKSISVNVSDIAAMGGIPRYVTIALGCPKDFEITEFYSGVKAACQEYNLRVAGGDLSSSKNLFISVAILGSSIEKPIKRSTARVNDHIFLTGPTGASAAGLELLQQDPSSSGPLQQSHKLPKARVDAAMVMSRLPANSAIDVSDGLIGDLNHICTQSNLGAVIETMPVAEGATLEHCMYGGEDYEIIFTHPNPELVMESFSEQNISLPIDIGRFRETKGILYRNKPLVVKGYAHDL